MAENIVEELFTEPSTEQNIPQKCEYVNAVVFNDAGEALVIELQSATQAVGRWAMLEAAISEVDDPLAAVQDALLVQTGYRTQQWNYVGTYLRSNHDYSGAGHIFIGMEARKSEEPKQRTPDRAPRWISRTELRYGLIDGRILSIRYALNVALALLLLMEG